MRQERLNFACPHIARMPNRPAIALLAYEKPYPIHIDLLGAEAIVHVPNTLAQLVQHTGGLQLRGAGFHEIFITGHISSIFRDQLGCKPLPGGIHDQLMEQRPSYRAGFALDITLGLTKNCCLLLFENLKKLIYFDLEEFYLAKYIFIISLFHLFLLSFSNDERAG